MFWPTFISLVDLVWVLGGSSRCCCLQSWSEPRHRSVDGLVGSGHGLCPMCFQIVFGELVSLLKFGSWDPDVDIWTVGKVWLCFCELYRNVSPFDFETS